MAAAVSDAAVAGWRPRKRLWALFGGLVVGSVVLGAIGDWRDDHALLINTTDSLPNWAFVIHRNKVPVRGEYVFFDPPPSELVRRHFGAKPQMFGKIVYRLPGDVVAHWHRAVTVNGRVAKPALRVKSGDVVTLDGRKQDWEAFAASLDENGRRFVVYNKPTGVTISA